MNASIWCYLNSIYNMKQKRLKKVSSVSSAYTCINWMTRFLGIFGVSLFLNWRANKIIENKSRWRCFRGKKKLKSLQIALSCFDFGPRIHKLNYLRRGQHIAGIFLNFSASTKSKLYVLATEAMEKKKLKPKLSLIAY